MITNLKIVDIRLVLNENQFEHVKFSSRKRFRFERRSVVLINRNNLSLHLVWFIVFVGGTFAAAVSMFDFATNSFRPPRGSTFVGLSFGVVGALIIVFEILLWPRKKLRRWRLGRVRSWMSAHIWLGLLTIPLAIAHGGFVWGGSLAIALMIVLIVVVVSGIFGLVLQQYLPRSMLKSVPDETIFSQIENIGDQYVVEADAVMATTCGFEIGEARAKFWSQLYPTDLASDDPNRRVVGASRSIATMKGTAIVAELPRDALPNTELLNHEYRTRIRDYLDDGRRSNSDLQHEAIASDYFRDLRSRSDPETHETIQLLQQWCEQRRHLDKQTRLHAWLHGWLAVHVPLSLALLVLLIWHIVVALKFSGIYSFY